MAPRGQEPFGAGVFSCPQMTFARIGGSNDQCEQFNYADSDHQRCKCYRIVLEPMLPFYVHGAPLFALRVAPNKPITDYHSN